jgi:hypothetical protein
MRKVFLPAAAVSWVNDRKGTVPAIFAAIDSYRDRSDFDQVRKVPGQPFIAIHSRILQNPA